MRFDYLKKLVVLLALVLCHNSYSQNNGHNDEDEYMENRDSIWGIEFDYSGLDPKAVKLDALAKKIKRIKAYNDSVMAALRMKNIKERSDSLEQLYDLLAGDTTSSYNAYSFFAGQFHSTISALNNGLASLGWQKLPEMSYHVTNFLDFTWKRKRIINDIFISQGSARTVTKSDVSVTYNYISPVNYNIGFCIIDRKRVQFFPYAGLLYQISQLDFANTDMQPFDLKGGLYDTLVKAAKLNKQGAEYMFKKQELVLNYGAELDIHIVYSKRKTGFILGFRSGGGLPVLSSGWRLSGTRYAQFNNIKIRDYYYDVVLRVYLRRPTHSGPFFLRNNWWEN